jgi:hypothetical protein
MLDWNTIIASLLASTAFSSVVTGIIAPSINWGIEKKKQTRSDRKEKIHKWQQMVQRVILELDNIQRGESPPITGMRSPAAYLLDRELDFSSLKPLLPKSAIGEIYVGMTFIAGPTIDSKLVRLIDEIARIEKEWGLV